MTRTLTIFGILLSAALLACGPVETAQPDPGNAGSDGERSPQTLTSTCVGLGYAAPYSEFVFGNDARWSSDIQGRVAVGGNAWFQGFAIGDMVTPTGGDVLRVGGNLTFTNGALMNGTAIVRGTRYVSSASGSFGGSSIDLYSFFNNARSQLRGLASAITDRRATAPTNIQWGGAYLVGTSAGVNIFHIKASDFRKVWGFDFRAPAGATMVVVVDNDLYGTIARPTSMGCNFSGGVMANNVLFVFGSDVSSLRFGGSVCGSVLAPYANVTADNGLITGQIVAYSMSGTAQVNLAPFAGCPPIVIF